MFVNGSGRNEYRYRGPSIDASYLSFTSFGWGISEEKVKMWKVKQMTDDGRQVMVKAHIAFGKVI